MTAQVAWGWEDPATSPPSWVDPAAPSPLCLSRKCLASSAGSKMSTERSLEPFIVMIIVMIDYFWRPISEEPGVLTMAYGYMLISSHTSTHMHTLSLSVSVCVCLSLSLSHTHTYTRNGILTSIESSNCNSMSMVNNCMLLTHSSNDILLVSEAHDCNYFSIIINCT